MPHPIVGTDFSTARRDLLTLASILRSNLEVSSSGELLFNIPSNYESLLYQRSVGRRMQRLYQTASPTLLYLFRISFGVMIVGSTALLATLILTSMFSGSASDDSDSDSSSKSSLSKSSSISTLFDIVDFIRIITYYKDENSGVGNFLEAVYSYLFGDEDPNKGCHLIYCHCRARVVCLLYAYCSMLLHTDFESQLFRRVAATIRQFDGIVISEQIAAFASVPPMLPTVADQSTDVTMVDESYMLPMAVRFGGSPIVTEEGNIVYLFEVH